MSLFSGHSGSITAISFSENGYYLATAAGDYCVRLWDLRKLKNFKTLPLENGYEIKDLSFDQSGTYLAVAGTDVRYVFGLVMPIFPNFKVNFSKTTLIENQSGKIFNPKIDFTWLIDFRLILQYLSCV